MGILAIHIVLAFITVTIFAVEHAQPDGYSLSTAFWLTVVSAIIALSVTCSLLIDGFRTRWYHRGGTGLTGEQRSLVLVFNFFIINIIIGAIAYRYLLPSATFLDSSYFSVQSTITVGFGDVLPKSAGARAFTIVYLSFSIVNFAILLAFIRSTALEALKERYKARERRTLERIKTRHSSLLEHHSKKTTLLIYLSLGLYHPQHTKEGALESRSSTSQFKEDRSERRKQKHYAYEEKIEELNRDQRIEFRSQLVVATIGVLLTWLLGAAVFMRLEGWSYWISVYFCYVSISTLGLGDYSPSSQAGRAFFCIWALLGAGILTVFFSVIADEYSAHYKETFQRNILSRFQKPEPEHHHHHSQPSKGPSPHRQVDRIPTTESVSRDLKNGAHIEIVEKEGPVEEEDGVTKRTRGSKKERVSALLSETRLHLQHLATRDSSDTETIDLVVRRVMDEQSFAIRNRELVEQDKGLKEFIFLRNLVEVFHELESLTNELIDESTSQEQQNVDITTGSSSSSSRSAEDRGKGNERDVATQ